MRPRCDYATELRCFCRFPVDMERLRIITPREFHYLLLREFHWFTEKLIAVARKSLLGLI